ncbi:MAG: hypothetical protein KDJ49_07310 [Alphaproteobacteria bacterium]|nr:hypothetical protein [Alphaproteobacteria bacterium]USO08030.1 MAG: hypothetical protein H6866_02095 [Rhodospirillales bacterium]
MARAMRMLILMLAAFFASFQAGYAATSYTLAYDGSVQINEFSNCRVVNNGHPSQKSVFIATKTTNEWTSFYTNPPMGVTATGCTLATSGAVASWGQVNSGALGDGVLNYFPVPGHLTTVGGANALTFKKVALGAQHACGILMDDTMRCWGYNGYGQLGYNSGVNTNLPTALYGSFATTTWKDVFSGSNTICAIRKTDNVMFCWGYNAYGEVGDGTTTNRTIPQTLDSSGGWDTTAWDSAGAVFYGFCAIRSSDKHMFCWGRNTYGELGNGSTDGSLTAHATPAPLTSTGGWDTTAWKSVGGGANHFCAVRNSDSKMFCWGRNIYGALGTGDTTDQSVPTALGGGFSTTAWKSMQGYDLGSCALRSDNVIYCWGYGRGNGSSSSAVSVPTALGDGFDTTTWSAFGTGTYQTCAIRASDSQMYCWGSNGFGALGTGDYTNAYTPVSLAGVGGWSGASWKGVAAGTYFACGIMQDDTLVCWGRNQYGQLANNLFNRSVPGTLATAGGWDTTAWSHIGASVNFACGIRASDSKIYCWGEGSYGNLGNNPADQGGSYEPTALTSTGGFDAMTWSAVSAFNPSVCALRSSDSHMFCWGYNAYGQLGDGTTTSHTTPASLSSTGGWDTTVWESLATSSQANHFCAIRASDHRIFCWGYNWAGQLGDGTTTSSSVPIPLSSSGGWDTTQWKSVSVGNANTCAIRLSDEHLFCWGGGGYYALGNGGGANTSVPVSLSSSGGWDTMQWSKVAVGYFGACAIRKSDSQMFCWGYNAFGQVGDGTTANKTIPTALGGGFSATAWSDVGVSGSPARTCAIRTSDKHMYCWGDNRDGELGDGTTTNRTTPVALTTTNGWDATTWSGLALGVSFTLGIKQ